MNILINLGYCFIVTSVVTAICSYLSKETIKEFFKRYVFVIPLTLMISVLLNLILS